MKTMRRSMRKSRGQGMTEYIIIVALIAIAAIGVITLFGNNIRRLFGQSADALAGNANVTNDARSPQDGDAREQEDGQLRREQRLLRTGRACGAELYGGPPGRPRGPFWRPLPARSWL